MTPEVTVGRVARNVILELRERVLSRHGQRVAVLHRDGAQGTRHWAAWSQGVVVGCVSVMDLRGYALRGLAVAPEHRRRGIGSALMRAACAEVAAPMWCNARLEVVPFYAALGWKAAGPVFELQDQGPHQRLTWAPPPAT